MAFWQVSKGREHKIMAVLCDGIGGLPGGEQASSYVVRQMANWFMSRGYKQNGKKREKMVQQLFFQIDEELKGYGRENESRLGTTVTIVLLDKYRLSWFHCGDCRLYLFHGKKVRKLTKDHQNEKGNLNRAIGVGEWKLLDSGKMRIRKKDKILLCTDGLYRNMDLEELRMWGGREVENDEQARRMLKQLYQKKVSKGEMDNISAIYFGYIAGQEGGEHR